MGTQRMMHPCVHAKGNNGINAYYCEILCSNCTSQFYCHNEHYWKPLYQIKCSNFQDKTNMLVQPLQPQPEEKKEEGALDNTPESK